MATEDRTPRMTVTYRAALPPNPADWTLGLIRQFVKDADALSIQGSTRIKRFPESDSFAFATDNRYYGLGVERVVSLDPQPEAAASDEEDLEEPW